MASPFLKIYKGIQKGGSKKRVPLKPGGIRPGGGKAPQQHKGGEKKTRAWATRGGKEVYTTAG